MRDSRRAAADVQGVGAAARVVVNVHRLCGPDVATGAAEPAHAQFARLPARSASPMPRRARSRHRADKPCASLPRRARTRSRRCASKNRPRHRSANEAITLRISAARRSGSQRLREIAGFRLHLVEQPDILDRDHRLVGEGLRAARSACRRRPRARRASRNHSDPPSRSSGTPRKSGRCANPVAGADDAGLDASGSSGTSVTSAPSCGQDHRSAPCRCPC